MDGVNRLLVGPITIPEHEQDVAITVSYADADSGVITEADTIFNSAYAWTNVTSNSGEHRCKEAYDLQNVATHEAGHFFGLGEDYDDKTTTMYVYSYDCQISKRVLSTPDIAAIAALYSQPLAVSFTNAGWGAQVVAGATLAWEPVAALALLLLGWRRHRDTVLRRMALIYYDGSP